MERKNPFEIERNETISSFDVRHITSMKNERKKNKVASPWRCILKADKIDRIANENERWNWKYRPTTCYSVYSGFSKRRLFLVRFSNINTKRRSNATDVSMFLFQSNTSRYHFLKTSLRWYWNASKGIFQSHFKILAWSYSHLLLNYEVCTGNRSHRATRKIFIFSYF